jgi:hypothetical protein
MTAGLDIYLAGCAIYKNEAHCLGEWLEFHRLVGFEKFYLYDNASTDHHHEVLEPFVRDGFVELIDWPVVPGQIPAYQHCLRRARDEARWVGFFDVDEFCFSPLGRPVPEVLGEYESHAGVGVCIVLFGTSNHVEKPDGLVTENYVLRESKPRNHVKSIVDPRRTVECMSPHYFRYLQPIWPGIWAEVLAVDERRRDIPISWTESASVEQLRLNHYYFKSESEATEKFKHGQAHNAQLRDARILDFLHESNAVEDREIQMYLPALRDALAPRHVHRPRSHNKSLSQEGLLPRLRKGLLGRP